MCHLTCFRGQIVVNYKSLELQGEYRDGPLAWDCSADGSAGHFVGNRKYDKGVCVMANYFEMTRDELTAEKAALEEEYKKFQAMGLKLNMACLLYTSRCV